MRATKKINLVSASLRACERSLTVPEKRLDNVLAIIECSLHSYAVYVGVQHAGHLHLLDGRHTPLRKQDETFDTFLPPLHTTVKLNDKECTCKCVQQMPENEA